MKDVNEGFEGFRTLVCINDVSIAVILAAFEFDSIVERLLYLAHNK